MNTERKIDKTKVKAAFVSLPSIPNGTELVFRYQKESAGWGIYGMYENNRVKVCIPAARIQTNEGELFPSKIQITGPDKFREIE